MPDRHPGVKEMLLARHCVPPLFGRTPSNPVTWQVGLTVPPAAKLSVMVLPGPGLVAACCVQKAVAVATVPALSVVVATNVCDAAAVTVIGPVYATAAAPSRE